MRLIPSLRGFFRNTLLSARPRTDRASRRDRFRPVCETLEERCVPTAGVFFQGTSFIDTNDNSKLDVGESPLAGATIQLRSANGSILLGQTTTGADGAYLFDDAHNVTSGNLLPGTYQLVQLPPTPYISTGTHADSKLYPVVAQTASSMTVTAINPTGLKLEYLRHADPLGPGLDGKLSINYVYNGTSHNDYVGQFIMQAIVPPTNPGDPETRIDFVSVCVDIPHPVIRGAIYGVLPSSAEGSGLHGSDALPNHIGEVAYLHNHYGATELDRIRGAALQLAVYELEYDVDTDLLSGNFHLPSNWFEDPWQADWNYSYYGYSTGAVIDVGSGQPLMTVKEAVLYYANDYLAKAAGKHEMAMYLDASDFIENPWRQGMMVVGSYNFANQVGQDVTTGQAATIGFWHNKNGQALIKSFNGSDSSTALGNWLAATFPNLYGSTTGTNNMTGKTNTDVARYFTTLFKQDGQKAQAQVLANALAIYATTASLGGNAATQYGFTVSAAGVGASTFNVGNNGAAFGVANGTSLTVMQVLQEINRRAVNGSLYGGDTALTTMANEVCTGINEIGDIL